MLDRCPIGIRNGSLGAEWQTAFHAAQDAGAECLELACSGELSQFPLFSESGRARLRDLERETGVRLVSFCLGTFWRHSPASPDPATRRMAAGLLAESLRACDAHGVAYLLVPLSDWKNEAEAGIEAQRAGWREVLETARADLLAARVRTGFELCGKEFLHSVDDLLGLLDAARVPPSAGAYYDVANGHARGHRPARDIPRLNRAGRLCAVHLKDTAGKNLGEGEVDFTAVKTALEAVAYAGPLVLETPAGAAPGVAARRNLAFAKELIRGTRPDA